ncbi:MaoC family dehydratase [bacterium]|nr:MaoC family dehydratase [bacterium]
MNKYSYDELKIGQKESFEVVVTEQMQTSFLNLSGDINPLHCNCDFAKEKGFNDKVVYGMLTSSFYSTLVGVYLPGENCLFQEAEIQFNKPVYIGDKLIVSGEVTEKQDLYKRIVVKAKITANEKTVSKAKLTLGVLN